MCEWSSDGDGPSAYREQTRKARVSHRCWECSGTIARGEQYRYISGVWDGRGESFKQCSPCAAASKAFAKEHKAPHDIGGLDEALAHCIEEETSFDDDDNEILTEAGKRWKAEQDAMNERRSKRQAARVATV